MELGIEFNQLDWMDYFMIVIVLLAACCWGINKFFIVDPIERRLNQPFLTSGGHGHGNSMPKKIRKDIQNRDMTREALLNYRAKDNEEPLLISCKGEIFDVSTSEGFYGPNGPYSNFTGHEASRALAKHSTKLEDCQSLDLSDVSPSELNDLDEWYLKYKSKYPVVGRLLDYDFKKQLELSQSKSNENQNPKTE